MERSNSFYWFGDQPSPSCTLRCWCNVIRRHPALTPTAPYRCCLQTCPQETWECLSLVRGLMVISRVLGSSGFPPGTVLPFNLANGVQKEGVQRWDWRCGWEADRYPYALLLVPLPAALAGASAGPSACAWIPDEMGNLPFPKISYSFRTFCWAALSNTKLE